MSGAQRRSTPMLKNGMAATGRKSGAVRKGVCGSSTMGRFSGVTTGD